MCDNNNSISLGQLDGAVLIYEDGDGNTIRVPFDGSGPDELNKNSKDNETGIPKIKNQIRVN